MQPGSGTRGTAGSRRAALATERLSRDPRVRLVYLFGSATDETVDEIGDVDIAVLAEPPIEAAELLRIRADLGEDSLDLVALDRASVTLRHQVAEHGRCLFAREPEDELEFVTWARSQFWDFSPYLATQWKLAGERLEARRHGSQA